MIRNIFAILVAAVLLLVANTNAFTPSSIRSNKPAFLTPSSSSSKTKLQFKFLKDLGLEKPSWLPDFGGEKKKEEEATPASASAEEEETEEGETAEVAAE